eukprot:gene15395-18258_t
MNGGGDQQNGKHIGVAPLRTSTIIKQGSAPSMVAVPPPKRTFSVSIAAGSQMISPDQQPLRNNGAAAADEQTPSPKPTPRNPPKLAPRSPSSLNSDTSSFLGESSLLDVGDLIEQKEDDDDSTDEEEEEMHDNFLKELGLGNKERITDLKQQEKLDMEMMAGGTKFRVTRCFVGLSPTSAAPAAAPAPSSAQHPNGSSANSLRSNQPRQSVYNPRYSIYRPLNAPPRKPLPPPPRRQPPKYTAQQEAAAIKIQRAFRRYRQMLPFKKLKIYNTERTYTRTLEQLSTHFIEPLRKNNLISVDDVKLIFGGLDSIIGINLTLFSDIEHILKNWTPYSIIGKSFTTLGVFLKAYTDYVKNFDHSLQRIEACSKDMKFVAFIKAAEDRMNPRSRLESLLITPVQRIPRYVLLLQDLLKHTEESHPDYPHISEGLEIIKRVAMSINDTKRRADNSLKVIEAQNKLIGKFPNLVVADRRYVHEGYLLSGPSNLKAKKVYIFLFNDILIFSRPSSNKIFSKAKFKFLKIEDLLPSPQIIDIPNNPIMQCSFEVELQSSTCTFFGESEEAKKLWMGHFKKVFDDINIQKDAHIKLDKRAVERADQAKTYIDNFFTNIKVKGRVTRGGTSIIEERLKGMAEETSQLKMEHARETTVSSPMLMSAPGAGSRTVGRSTISRMDFDSHISQSSSMSMGDLSNGHATLSSDAKKTSSNRSAPSLNKIFSSMTSEWHQPQRDGSQGQVVSSSESKEEKENMFYLSGQYDNAIDFYSKTKDILPQTAIYTNRSLSYYKLGKLQESLQDAVSSINLDATWINGYIRQALALKDLGRRTECK